MSLVSLASLRQQARARADMRINGIFTDADFNNAINQSIFELYDLQVKAWGDNYFIASSSLGLTPGQTQYPLPTGIYKLVGIDWQQSSGMPLSNLKTFEFAERNALLNASILWGIQGVNMRYCLLGSQVFFAPAPQAGNQVTFWYVPQPTALVNDTDTYDFQSGWEEFVIVNTAIKALAAEESDTSVFMAQKAEMKDRILDMAPKRNQAEPFSVAYIGGTDNDWWF